MFCMERSSESSSLVEEDVLRSVKLRHVLSKRCRNELLDGGDAVGRGRAGLLLDDLVDELTGVLIHVLDWHELLVEDDVASDGWGLDADDVADVFEDAEAEGKVLPEESGLQVELDELVTCWNLLQILSFNWNHWEGDNSVSLVRVEHGLETRLISDLASVHRANSVFEWHDLVQIDKRVFGENGLLDCLDFVVKSLDLVGTSLVQAFVQQRHVLLFEDSGALIGEFLEESCDSSRMDDLVAGAQSQVQE